jgi:hypothetical protein
VISRTTSAFWKSFDGLPPDIQRRASAVYELWRSDPAHPGLQFKCVSDKHNVFSVRIGLHWRALGYRETIAGQETVTWFWIGSHAEYDRLVATI